MSAVYQLDGVGVRAGEARIAASLEEMEPALRERSRSMVEAVKSGRRDVFC